MAGLIRIYSLGKSWVHWLIHLSILYLFSLWGPHVDVGDTEIKDIIPTFLECMGYRRRWASLAAVTKQ